MSLKSNDYKTESKFKTPDPLEVGTYPARVAQVMSLGLQKQDPYKGEEKPPKHELYVTYELLDEFLEDEEGNELRDKPRWLSETFTMNGLDSDLAKSTKRYYALDPDVKFGGDWGKLIGAVGMVTITRNEGKGKHAGKVFNNISSVQSMRSKEAEKAPDLVNKGRVFDISEPDVEMFLSLPQFLQDKMKTNLLFEGSVLEKALEAHKGSSGGEGSQDHEKKPQGASEGASGASKDATQGGRGEDEADW